eukprot:g71804.t1
MSWLDIFPCDLAPSRRKASFSSSVGGATAHPFVGTLVPPPTPLSEPWGRDVDIGIVRYGRERQGESDIVIVDGTTSQHIPLYDMVFMCAAMRIVPCQVILSPSCNLLTCLQFPASYSTNFHPLSALHLYLSRPLKCVYVDS